mmetsp:Transcript_9545/g.21512  ORF Transcript_9545/g.21512 Transcript_9545/m.21512 type:complete len:107 (+) Transcript_9545:371-691(+)
MPPCPCATVPLCLCVRVLLHNFLPAGCCFSVCVSTFLPLSPPPLLSSLEQKGADEPLVKCGVLRDDYLECLHSAKKIARAEQVRTQKAENERVLKSGGKIGTGGGH